MLAAQNDHDDTREGSTTEGDRGTKKKKGTSRGATVLRWGWKESFARLSMS